MANYVKSQNENEPATNKQLWVINSMLLANPSLLATTTNTALPLTRKQASEVISKLKGNKNND